MYMCPVGLGHERLHIYSFRNNKGGEGGGIVWARARKAVASVMSQRSDVIHIQSGKVRNERPAAYI